MLDDEHFDRIDDEYYLALFMTSKSLDRCNEVFRYFVEGGCTSGIQDENLHEVFTSLAKQNLASVEVGFSAMFDEYQKTLESEFEMGECGGSVESLMLDALIETVHLCAKTIRSIHANSTADECAIEATAWSGKAMGALHVWLETDHAPEDHSIRALARAGANARHAENRAMKSQIFEWYDSNRDSFCSLDAAAEAAAKIVPVKFRTARRWVGQCAKLPPTGKV